MQSVYLVVSGEFILDIGDVIHDGKLEPFRNPLIENCYHLSSGSILGRQINLSLNSLLIFSASLKCCLGDEGITGLYNQFDSTAVVASETAVVFETVGYGEIISLYNFKISF